MGIQCWWVLVGGCWFTLELRTQLCMNELVVLRPNDPVQIIYASALTRYKSYMCMSLEF